jgi:hypothetical protein
MKFRILPLTGWCFILGSIPDLFRPGESNAYHAGALSAVILGEVIVTLTLRAPSGSGAESNTRERKWWPEIRNRATARQFGLLGAYAGYLTAVLTCVFIVLRREYSSILDAVIFGILALYTQNKMSRAAAITALVLYGAERALVGIDRGLNAAINWQVLIILFAFMLGVQGTFSYHAYPHPQAEPHPKPREHTSSAQPRQIGRL